MGLELVAFRGSRSYTHLLHSNRLAMKAVEKVRIIVEYKQAKP